MLIYRAFSITEITKYTDKQIENIKINLDNEYTVYKNIEKCIIHI